MQKKALLLMIPKQEMLYLLLAILETLFMKPRMVVNLKQEIWLLIIYQENPSVLMYMMK